MNIGEKLKQLRIQRGLTMQELANRSELSKGFISQVERDLTSPSIATLIDILECLGTDLHGFFSDTPKPRVVYRQEDAFVQDNDNEGYAIRWIVPDAQKHAMEPILLELAPKARSEADDPHDGEEFGYVLQGTVILTIGEKTYRVRRGDCFQFRPGEPHWLYNPGQTPARVLWVSSPPSF